MILDHEIAKHDRRAFSGMATTAAGARSCGLWSAQAAASQPTARRGALSRIDAGDLSVEYADLGPRDGAPALPLHGWPHDMHSFVEVAPLLVAKGRRVIIPCLRGDGDMRFRSPNAMLNGQQAALASDTIMLMDALGIHKAILSRFDWRARTADIADAVLEAASFA